MDFSNVTAAQIREWAKTAGIKVEDRGRLDHAVVLAFAVAHMAGATPTGKRAAKVAEASAEAPATDGTVKVDVRSFVKVNGDWFVRVLDGDTEGDTVEVARRNRPATMATIGAIETRKIGAQTYRVAPMVKTPVKTAEKPAEAPATATVAKVAAAVEALPIGTLTVNGNTVYTVTNGTMVRVFATLAEAAAYAVNPV